MSEYAVSSRDMPWWMVLFTVMASWTVGGFYTAWFGWAVLEGSIVLYIVISGLVGAAVFYFIAPRVWAWGKIHNLLNMPDYIRLRYNHNGVYLLVIIGVVIVLNWPWQVVALKTFGYVVSALSYGMIPKPLGIGVFATAISLYCIYGGMRSVVLTDFVQGIICTLVAIVGFLFVVQKQFGGPAPLFQRVLEEKPELLTIENPNYFLGLLVAAALTTFCWPEMFNRIFLAKSPADVKAVIRFAPIVLASLKICMLTLAIGGGILVSINGSQAAAESGFLTLFEQTGGPAMLALASIVIIAAIMSSLDSQLTAVGTIFSNNIVAFFKKDPLTDAQNVRISRWFIFLYMFAISIIAMGEIGPLVRFAIVSIEFLICFFPTILLGIFFRRANGMAALASIIGGTVTCGILQLFPDLQIRLGGYGPGLPGALVSAFLYFIVGYFSREDERVNKLFEEVESKEF